MSGPDCMWCGQTIHAHSESGPAAKTPCGMLKRGFVAEKPADKRSVGDVPAPKRQQIDALDQETLTMLRLAVNAERAAVVKYLRARAAEQFRGGTRAYLLNDSADAIEKGEHLK